MKKQLQFIATVLILFTLASCASLTGFEEGKVLGEDNKEIIVSLNTTRSPDLLDDDFNSDINSTVFFPNVEFSFKYGINEKFDIGVKTGTSLNTSIISKYQLVGDKTSKFALSPGIEVGTVLGLSYYIGIPIYTSYYPSESITINFAPRFTFQSIAVENNPSAGFLGGNFGLLFGKKNKFGLDIGYYRVGVAGVSPSLFTFGIGGKFRVGEKS